MDIWIIIPAILVIIGIVIGLIVFYVMRTKKKDIEKDTDYQAIFSVGFIWIPVGVVFMITVNPALGIAFMALGIVYIALGLAHKDTWKINKRNQ